MAELLGTLLALLVAPLALVAAAGAILWLRLQRANRVTPRGGAMGAAPLAWLWSPGTAAMMHRRLRSACILAASVAGPEPKRRRLGRAAKPGGAAPLDRLARDVVAEAMRVDRQLVAAHRTARGVARAQALVSLDHEVKVVEDSARRVHELAARHTALGTRPAPGALNLQERIAAMEAAFGELQRP